MSNHPFRTLLFTGMTLLIVALAGCSHPVMTPARPPASIAPPPRDPSFSLSSQPEITGVWQDFWSRSWSLDQKPLRQWQPTLIGTADGPMTDQLVQRKGHDLGRGVRLYGQVQPHVTAVEVGGDQARVTDCQDASRAGQADLAGHPKTVGVARHRVLGTVVRTSGGWRVSRVEFPGGGC